MTHDGYDHLRDSADADRRATDGEPDRIERRPDGTLVNVDAVARFVKHSIFDPRHVAGCAACTARVRDGFRR